MPTHFIARSTGMFSGGGLEMPCALGKRGLIAARDKREGDGASPIGAWPARALWYRADREAMPETGLPVRAIAPEDGWCDDPASPQYNSHVTKPFAASHEDLWRENGVYDLIVTLGHNDDPVVPGLGSAIFLHVAREGHLPTEGCVALAAADLRRVLRLLEPGSLIEIRR